MNIKPELKIAKTPFLFVISLIILISCSAGNELVRGSSTSAPTKSQQNTAILNLIGPRISSDLKLGELEFGKALGQIGPTDYYSCISWKERRLEPLRSIVTDRRGQKIGERVSHEIQKYGIAIFAVDVDSWIVALLNEKGTTAWDRNCNQVVT